MPMTKHTTYYTGTLIGANGWNEYIYIFLTEIFDQTENYKGNFDNATNILKIAAEYKKIL